MSEENKDKKRGFVLEPDEPVVRNGKNYLLVIGIDQYPEMPALSNAVLDARKIASLLTDRYQFSEEALFTLFDAEASQDAIISKLRELADIVTAEDTLLVYFAGHGEYDKKIDVGYWIPYDAKKGQIGSYISFDLVSRLIRAINTHHTFVLSDSCYSGSFFTTHRSIDSPVVAKLEATPSRWLLTSGRKEAVSDGREGGHSPFAQAVIKQLERNQEPYLLVSEFVNKVVVSVGNNNEQVPIGAPIQDVGDEGGQFVFMLKSYVEAKSNFGGILYFIPSQMTEGVRSKCIVRITYDKEVLLKRLPIPREEWQDRSVRILRAKKAELISLDEEAFSIKSLNQTEFLEEDEHLEWTYYVLPKASGTHLLILTISVAEAVKGKERGRDIVLEQSVRVAPRAKDNTPAALSAPSEEDFEIAGVVFQKYQAYEEEKMEAHPAAASSRQPAPEVVPAPSGEKADTKDTFKPLRTLEDVRTRLKDYIRESEFEQAFELFNQIIDDRSSRENDIIMQQSQYSSITKQMRNNLVDPNFANVTLNRIRFALSSIVDDLKEEDLKAGALQPEAPPAGAGNGNAYLDELERQGLEEQAEILARKLNYFRAERAKAYDASQKFALEEQINETERQLQDIKNKLQ
ncbi:MAG: caspase family protein [Phaeodactylibacter sp.]|nr:caspase family protein [Phaeodactylibacter sp.]MCB9053261.1 caspase family protein [Lewinellaceae bacterium]